jgi:TPR repeat protein
LGNGVPKDDVEAVQWFRKAAEQGDANGETFLGAAYSNGKGIPIDKAEAATWWRKAAEQGNPDGEDFRRCLPAGNSINTGYRNKGLDKSSGLCHC